MTSSNHKKVFKQLKTKPAKMKKFIKHNTPKKRITGALSKRCKMCGTTRAHISKYGLHLCRRCFRDYAQKIGFKKYS